MLRADLRGTPQILHKEGHTNMEKGLTGRVARRGARKAGPPSRSFLIALLAGAIVAATGPPAIADPKPQPAEGSAPEGATPRSIPAPAPAPPPTPSVYDRIWGLAKLYSNPAN